MKRALCLCFLAVQLIARAATNGAAYQVQQLEGWTVHVSEKLRAAEPPRRRRRSSC